MLRNGTESWDELGGLPWDAIVIGAGPAGSLAARELAAGGARVLLVEHRRFPRAKVCGGCLNGRALAVLRAASLGSLVVRSGGVPLEEFQLRFRGRQVRLELPIGAALSRARLDAELVAAATDVGAHFLPETRALVGGFGTGTRRVHLQRRGETRELAARVVLVAAGLGHRCLPPGSTAQTHIAPGSPIGAGCRIPQAPACYGSGTIFMAIGRQGYVGLVRLEDGSLNVAAALQPEFLRRHGTPAAAAEGILAESGFPPIDTLGSACWQGTVPLTRRTRPPAEERLFLLGDAAGYVEPFTGEGIAWALASGRVIAPMALRAIARWDQGLVRDWDVLHNRLVRRRQIVSRAAAAALHRPWLAHLGFEALNRMPAAIGCVLRYVNAPASLPEVS
jgi:flavin-dependent dehydrogenase